MRRTICAAVALLGLGWLAGCDGNPDGPTFPTVPPGTKVIPASTAPVVIPDGDAPAKKGNKKPDLQAAPVQAG